MDLYGEIILDHFKNPRHFGLLKDSSIIGEDLNPSCGDKMKTSLELDSEGKISNYGFEGEGCAISMAAASILGENLVGRSLAELESMENEKLYELLGVPVSPGRVKCALLGLSCLKKSIKLYNAQKKVS